MQCKQCGKENKNSADFCITCGARLPRALSCAQCGHQNKLDAAFCIRCGQPLSLSLCCPQCGRENKPGADFCIICGAPLQSPREKEKPETPRQPEKEPLSPSPPEPEGDRIQKDQAPRSDAPPVAHPEPSRTELTSPAAEDPETHAPAPGKSATPKPEPQETKETESVSVEQAISINKTTGPSAASTAKIKSWIFIAAGALIIAAFITAYFTFFQPQRNSLPADQPEQTTALMREYTAGPFSCVPGKSLLYVSDFDDEEMPDWKGLFSTTHSFDRYQGRGGVLAITPGNSDSRINFIETIADVVVHFEMLRETGDMDVALEFLSSPFSRYSAGFTADTMFLDYQHDQEIQEITAVPVPAPNGSQWEKVSVAFYKESISVWWNDQLLVQCDDPHDLPPGNLMLVVKGNGKLAMFDNLTICALDAPYAPQ